MVGLYYEPCKSACRGKKSLACFLVFEGGLVVVGSAPRRIGANGLADHERRRLRFELLELVCDALHFHAAAFALTEELTGDRNFRSICLSVTLEQ